jgi:hypothetical protein
MEAWELKAGLEVILGSANRELTLSDLARGLGIDERAAEDASRRSMRFGESRVWSGPPVYYPRQCLGLSLTNSMLA